MIKVELPLDIGTFVREKDTNFIGTVNAYTVFSDGYLVWVSGYRNAECGEFELEELEVLTEDEIKEIEGKYGVKK